ncbi:putative toxin-antitoxin system antitoxin component, TIGR02293 family [Marinomonas polaris DSM 16579]|jgi:antitoxin StbD|uniref:Putative toxin-antitoxin system antitoxin component, TIGR02293 family n=1 Tax=Marinomonas polaris DSM 16579 TaxID=1122206 RepID=A0A1M5KK48_9GAMM|nr:MbcA/ParS/Xre antitoxin family protein [Marinomonas polaris]SHG53050.1 putative toxin-antitoxin system antitoxin component, TIGR02293 family [Marinomonas polaris DSM 16579]
MSTKRKNYAEKCIDIHDIESSLDLVMNESNGSPVAVMKDGNPVFYCVPADTYAAMLEAVEASEMRARNEKVHQLGLELFGDEGKWKSWIKTPVLALGGKSPESMMVTKEGINRVRDLLGQISHGVVV